MQLKKWILFFHKQYAGYMGNRNMCSVGRRGVIRSWGMRQGDISHLGEKLCRASISMIESDIELKISISW